MKPLFFMLAVAFISLPAFAFNRGEGQISRVSELPTKQLNCGLLFEYRGLNAQLKLSDGGVENGISYLTGTLTLTKDGAIVMEQSDLQVLIDRDLSQITAGYLFLDGLEGAPSVSLQMRQNAMLSSGDLIGYSGAVDAQRNGGLGRLARSNAACVFGKK